MGNLAFFFAENAIQDENIKFVASKRFCDDEGNPLEWEIRAVSSAVDEEIRKACRKRVPVPGKKGQFVNETDYEEYVGKLATVCTVYPDLKDASLQNSYHVVEPHALLKAMLKPGEYADYLKRVQEICGFNTTMDEDVEEAKN